MSEAEGRIEEATLGGGCFWCLEAVYTEVEGVHDVRSGYAAGQVPDPTYRQVCSGSTGHAEVVRVSFDPDVVDYADLLRIFFVVHDPTTLNRQGADVGTQYRSIILTHGPEQQRIAREVMEEVRAEALYRDPLVTEVEEAGEFWPAEPEHHRYYERNPGAGYCRVVVAPKVAKFRERFARLRRGAA
jgi:peptide-methionine (S)-S-oxide reductase